MALAMPSSTPLVGIVKHTGKTLPVSLNQGYLSQLFVAGNKSAASDVKKILAKSVPHVVVTKNVMPEINVLQVEPARQAIRELYLQEITKAKGLDVIQEEVGLAMPTPLAVMKAGELFNKVTGKEVVIVDVGGCNHRCSFLL